MGVLSNHRDATDFFTTRFGNTFLQSLERGRIAVGQIPGYKTIRTRCTDCDDWCSAIRHCGERLLIQIHGNRWIIHQCPQPNDVLWADDHDQRDGDGELVARGKCDVE